MEAFLTQLSVVLLIVVTALIMVVTYKFILGKMSEDESFEVAIPEEIVEDKENYKARIIISKRATKTAVSDEEANEDGLEAEDENNKG